MPRNARQWARRELDRAAGLCDNIGVHLDRIESVYRPVRPHIADATIGIMTLLRECQSLMTEMRKLL